MEISMEISKGEIQNLEKQVSPLVKQAGSYVINSVESVDEASKFLRQVKDVENGIEKKRLELTAPLNQSLKAINELFRNLKNPLEQARYLLTNKILSWKRAEIERLEKEEARRRAIQDAHEKAGHQVNAPVVLERPDNKIGNTQMRKVWKYKIVDFENVPNDYKLINQPAINNAIRSGIRKIQGLDIFQEEALSII